MSKNEDYVRLEDWLTEEDIKSFQPLDEILEIEHVKTTDEEAREFVEAISKEEACNKEELRAFVLKNKSKQNSAWMYSVHVLKLPLCSWKCNERI